MLPRRINLLILAFWAYAAWELFARDILPDLVVGPPPDFRSIAKAETGGVSQWSILVEDEIDSQREHSIGQVTTRSMPQADGGLRLDSKAWFDSASILKRGPSESTMGERIEIVGACWIDPRGNLDTFRVSMHEVQSPSVDLLMIEGRLKGDEIRIQTGGTIPYLGPSTFAYEPHSVVQTSFSPFDRLPGLRVGQKWEQQVINPITRMAMKCRSEVVGHQTLMYDGNPTSTLVVLTKAGGLSPSSRTWVRTDGLVIRQEVPLVIRNLILQRLPGDPSLANPEIFLDPFSGHDASDLRPQKPHNPHPSSEATPERRNPGDRR